MNTPQFIEQFRAAQADCHATANAKGWWQDREQLESICGNTAATQIDIACLALAMGELSEGIEWIRAGNPPDDKIPQFSGAEAEMADCVIRLMDLAERRGWRLAEAIAAKMEMNKGRSFRHGGKLA